VLHHRCEIELRRRDDDAERPKRVRRLVEHFGGIEDALQGMQPMLRQVPPSAFIFSMTATFIPSCAARIALGPEPMMTRSSGILFNLHGFWCFGNSKESSSDAPIAAMTLEVFFAPPNPNLSQAEL
jgi:hypothetical protein